MTRDVRRAVAIALACAASTAAVAPVAAAPLRPSGGQTGYVVAPPESFAAALPEVSKVIYLNRCAAGCDITGASRNDARSNESTIPPAGQIARLTPFLRSEDFWQATVACVREIYAPYDVQIVTDEPAVGVLHHEAIVAGSPEEVGVGSDVLGIAPVGYCAPVDNVISFTFVNRFAESQVLDACATIAQESAHAFGLDHEVDCSDPMTYLPSCGPRYFRDKNAPCGEGAARTCKCGSAIQNSHQSLLAVFGPGTAPSAPVLDVQGPADGSAVAAGFRFDVGAQHVRGIARLELVLNDKVWVTLPGYRPDRQADRYVLTAPEAVPDGIIDVEIRATGDLGARSSSTRTLTKGAACTGDATCGAGYRCDQGRCLAVAATGALGDVCTGAGDCASNVCATIDAERRCVESCFLGVSDACPAGFTCLGTTATMGVCWPEAEEGGGCCRVGDDEEEPWAALALIALVALRVVPGRRRAA